MAIELGSKARDKISGYEGIVTARTRYLSGCDRLAVQGKVDKDGKVPDAQYFDEPMLEVIEEPKSAQKPKSGMGAG